LFDLVALAITSRPTDSWTKTIGTGLFVLFGILLAGVIFITGIKSSRSTVVVWTTTLTWSVMFCWWAWVDTESSPFILHELHHFDAAQVIIEERKFYIENISIFTVMFVWLLSFPFVQRHASSKGQPAELTDGRDQERPE
jgi:hypothetical protein